jgi:hypothetical protein
MKTLYTTVENKESLGHFIRMCEHGLYGRAGIADIKKATETVLKQYS